MSKYAEVRGDFYDDIEGVQCIDAWFRGYKRAFEQRICFN